MYTQNVLHKVFQKVKVIVIVIVIYFVFHIHLSRHGISQSISIVSVTGYGIYRT